MIPGVHFGSGEGSAERLRGFVAGVRFLSFSGLKGSKFRTPAGRSICGGTWYFASGEGSAEGLRGPGARFVNFSRSVGSSFRIPAGNSRRRFRQSSTLSLSLSLSRLSLFSPGLRSLFPQRTRGPISSFSVFQPPSASFWVVPLGSHLFVVNVTNHFHTRSG